MDQCDVFVGLFGNEYGFEDAEGVSPTEREFDRATAAGKPRFIFVKGADNPGRHTKMQSLIRKAGSQLIRRRFENLEGLIESVNASLVDYLEERGIIQTSPFDERPCPGASLEHVDAKAVSEFVKLARHERQFPLPVHTPVADVLKHMHLLNGDHPTNAAILLFGREPQQFLPSAETRCMHFHGTEVQRPVPFYRIFKGSAIAQVDMAVDFVLSKINRSVGTRTESTQAPVSYEIPPDVIREAIVNAIAHRDYTVSGAVQVSVFTDRVEVWNPGVLPPPLTPESLRHPHGSVARNHRICEGLFLTRYIEKYGTGTLMMIRESLAHNLPEPDYEQRQGFFVLTLWRDWLTEAVMAAYGLNERQKLGIAFLKTHERITNAEYQQAAGASRATASRDLEELVTKGIFERVGKTGRAAHYVLTKKRLINASNDS